MNDSRKPGPLRRRPMKLSTTVSLMLGTVILVVLLSVHWLYVVQISNVTREGVKDKALAVARTLAASPDIQRGLTLPPDSNIIQPIAMSVQKNNGLLFVVVTNMQGRRYSHPNPQAINQHFIGEDLNAALQGHENIAVNKGILDEALRVFTPVYNAQRQQIGVVAIGISLSSVTQQINHSRWDILWTVLFGTLVGATGAVCLVTVLKRLLFGLEPYEISALFEQRQAMLQSIREGVIAVDDQAQVTLINEEARQLCMGSTAADAGNIIANLRDVLRNNTPRQDEEIHVNGRILLSNTVPVRSNGAVLGAICTFRDKTEVTQLMQRMSGMVNYVDNLRAHSHEFMNKLHVILGLLHMKSYTQLEDYILKTANNYQTEIGSLLLRIKSPVVAGFLLSKINHASDTGHQLTLNEDSFLPESSNEKQVSTLITVLGNLIENAFEAMSGQPEGEVNVLLHYQNGWLACEVSDDGPGIPAAHLDAIFEKGFSAKGERRGMGLFLTRQQTLSIGGEIIVESEPGVYTQFLVQLPWDGGNIRAC